MPRKPRVEYAGAVYHVMCRGNGGQSIYLDDADRRTYLTTLGEACERCGWRVHAFVMMGNHYHLLLETPEPNLVAGMKWLQGTYTQRFNRRHGRTGTLWEGRYRSTVLDPERYLLPCMVYLDLNPVRAGLVPLAADYAWSSHAHWLGLRHDRLLTPHTLYWGLGNTPFAREAAYAALVQAGIGSQEQAALTDSALSGWALGRPEFVEELQKNTQRRVARGQAGRPVSDKKI